MPMSFLIDLPVSSLRTACSPRSFSIIPNASRNKSGKNSPSGQANIYADAVQTYPISFFLCDFLYHKKHLDSYLQMLSRILFTLFKTNHYVFLFLLNIISVPHYQFHKSTANLV